MARLSSERYVVQHAVVRYAREAGWDYLAPQEALRLRHGKTSPILRDIFVEEVRKLNPGRVDARQALGTAKRLVRVPPSIEGNLQAWEFLNGLKTVFVPAERRELNLHLIDFESPAGNIFHVTDEFVFTNGTHTIRADVAFLVNGIPIILVETKAATRLEGIEEGLDQIRRYHREGPELLALAQLFNLTHLIHFYYGATWNLSFKDVFNWKDESPNADFEALVKSFVAPERVLRVLRDFILFTRKDDELKKVVLRPHQMRAVERAVDRAKDGEKRRGLIWHTQGSGKTYTMITIAKKLIEEPALENPTVLMLVDRTELEAQLFGNLAACGISHVEVAGSKDALRQLLGSDRRGLIVSMIHKFDDIPANLNTRQNVFVLVDEAHRTTGGDLGNYLMGALPNATYLGFTGTPIDRTTYGKGTFKVFGADDPDTGYLDKYSIAESIEDGTTVPLYYTIAPNELRPERDVLEREFLNVAEAQGVSAIEDLNRILDRAVNLRNMLKNRDRVQRVARHVAQHYRDAVEPMGFKAFLVGVDREACALYKEALDQYLPADYSQVVISPGPNDPPELARHHISEEEEKRIRKAFIKPDQLPKILIVTEKLLTGFDAPILYCMYLDKPMRDHVLLQAIARVNRPYEDENGKHKPGGFVLDFVGIFENNLEKALAFDSKDVQSVVHGLDVLKERFAAMMTEGQTSYLPLVSGKSEDKAAEAALEHFRDEEQRERFYQFYCELEDLYEIISPDPFLRAFLDDYNRVADLYALLRANFEAGKPMNRELARKTACLVQEHTQTGAIRQAVTVYEINAQTLKRIAESQTPETVKVFNLAKSVEAKVEKDADKEPYLFSIGERAAQIAEAFKKRQTLTEEALKALEELIQEINEAEKEQAERKVSTETFTAFWLLKRSGVAQADSIASGLQTAFDRLPHWRTSEHQAREVRQELYRLLVKAGVADVQAVAGQVTSALFRQQS